MWQVINLNLLVIWFRVTSAAEAESPATTVLPEDDTAVNKFGTELVTQLRNDANLDLSVDEEYEDLRAELLAYHTALAKLSDASTRRSLMTTACWQLGGICVNFKLCSGFRFLTEVPGCKDHHNVCCFTWNQYKVKDMRDHGINGPFPWSFHNKYGAPENSAVERSEEEETIKPLKKNKKKRKTILTVDKHVTRPKSSTQQVDDTQKNAAVLRNNKNKVKSNRGLVKNKVSFRSMNIDDERSDEDPDLLLRKSKKKKVESNTETLAVILRSV